MQVSPTERVAANVRAAAARKRVSQSELGAVLNLSQNSISRRLLGRQQFKVDELHKVAEHLDVSLESLIAVPTEAATA